MYLKRKELTKICQTRCCSYRLIAYSEQLERDTLSQTCFTFLFNWE